MWLLRSSWPAPFTTDTPQALSPLKHLSSPSALTHWPASLLWSVRKGQRVELRLQGPLQRGETSTQRGEVACLRQHSAQLGLDSRPLTPISALQPPSAWGWHEGVGACPVACLSQPHPGCRKAGPQVCLVRHVEET